MNINREKPSIARPANLRYSLIREEGWGVEHTKGEGFFGEEIAGNTTPTSIYSFNWEQKKRGGKCEKGIGGGRGNAGARKGAGRSMHFSSCDPIVCRGRGENRRH